ncbi:MAG: ankyrin repeat domain-containing protein [Candidatus Dependentiae bacterium]|nr:ankyrin repeat domain-containing protein [Candidatus Dependentiae bacterium]
MVIKKVSIISVIACLFFGVMPLLSMQGDPAGSTDIFDAVAKNNIHSVQYWLDKGGDINKEGPGHYTVLSYALERESGLSPIVELLIDHGALANYPYQAPEKNVALKQAAYSGNASVVELLINKNIASKEDIYALRLGNNTLLAYACSKRFFSLVKLLCDKGLVKNINDMDIFGSTPLHIIAGSDFQDDNILKIAQLLIAHGADVNSAKEDFRTTVLMEAVAYKNIPLIKFFMRAGANPYQKDKYGRDAFSIAKKNTEILEALLAGLPLADTDQLEQLKMPKVIGRMQHIIDNKNGRNRLHKALEIEEEEKKEAGEGFKQGHTSTDIHYAQFKEQIDQKYPKAFDDPIVKQCLQKEHQAYQEGKYVFYRAEPGELRVYEYFIQELYRIIRLYSKQAPFVFTRFFKDAAAQKTINEYVDVVKSTFSRGDLPNMLLSANIPLFGNVNNPTSCTWEYFLKNASVEKIDVQHLFKRIFALYQFDPKYQEQLVAIADYIQKKAMASLQQIIIPRDLVDNVAMLAKTGYCVPWPKMIDESCWDGQKGWHTKISPILDRYVGDSSFAIDDAWQVRLLMNAVYGLNPESGIEFHLYSRMPEKILLDLKNQIKSIVDILFSKWLEKELRDRGVSNGVEETDGLGKVFSFLGKGEHTVLPPERQQAVLRESYGELAQESIQRKVDLGAQAAGQARVRAVFGVKNRLQYYKSASIWEHYAQRLSTGQKIELDENSMQDLFISDCARDAEQNKRISKKDTSIARLATYNVHKWLDPKGTPNYQGILDTIKAINADVLVLQEVIFTRASICAADFQKLGYNHQVSMDTGNGLHNMIVSKYPFVQEPIKKVYKVDQDSELREKRNFINTRVQLPDGNTISVYGTHLDVWDESGVKRTQEVKELLTVAGVDGSTNILLAADWNAVRKKDYQYMVRSQVGPQGAAAAAVHGNLVWDLLGANFKARNRGILSVPTSALDAIETKGFQDSFTLANIVNPTYTVWTGTLVDFIFCAPTWQLPVAGSYVYFSSASDHVPVIMDIRVNKLKLEQAAAAEAGLQAGAVQ